MLRTIGAILLLSCVILPGCGSDKKNVDGQVYCHDWCEPGLTRCSEDGTKLLECEETDTCNNWTEKQTCSCEKVDDSAARCKDGDKDSGKDKDSEKDKDKDQGGDNGQGQVMCHDWCEPGLTRCSQDGKILLECVATDTCNNWSEKETCSCEKINDSSAKCSDGDKDSDKDQGGDNGQGDVMCLIWCQPGLTRCSEDGTKLLECEETDTCNNWTEKQTCSCEKVDDNSAKCAE